MIDAGHLLAPLLALHERIRDHVLAQCRERAREMAVVADASPGGDTIYALDRVGEPALVEGFEAIARHEPLRLIGEGLPEGGVVLPRGAPERDCRWRVLVDPIDGTRGLMYQKRSAWILTGVAPDRGGDTRLRDIVLAVQTEIPTLKQHLADQLWSLRGGGAHGRRANLTTGASEPLGFHPATADTIAHGFATVVRFFPGARDVLAALDDDLAQLLLGPVPPGQAGCFEDQYASTGGQLYELMAGHDRFIADLRPLVAGVRESRGLPRGLCCHPYDLASALIAEEAGIELTTPDGGLLDAPLDVASDVAWVGYANRLLRERVEPVLQGALRRHGLLPGPP